jgi:hypothetical protein
MNKQFQDNHIQIISMLLMTVTCTFVLFLLQGHQGFSLTDEGALWYGTQRVLKGEVPILDFMSYDIGRYYWSAAFMSLLGDSGIVALRMASSIFQASALSIGLILLARGLAKQSFLFWLLAAITMLVWMTPQYRLFDFSLPVILVGTLSFLVEQPTSRRYFLTGLIVGLVAVFGRNHGMYGAAGSLSAMIYLNANRVSGPGLAKAFAFWLLGVFAGYLPVLAFLAVVPGFAYAFWETFPFLFGTKASPLLLPVPWPWLVSFGNAPIVDIAGNMLVGILFIVIVIFGIVGTAWLIRTKLKNRPASPAAIASIFLVLPYAHYAYSRADIEHLAVAILPFLMAVIALSASQPARFKWTLVALLSGVSLFLMLPNQSRWHCYTNQCIEVNVAGDNLKIDAGTASDLATISAFAEQFAPGDRTFITAPFWPGAYAVLKRKSPMWEIFALFPRSVSFQQDEIERIKVAKPGFAIIYDLALDGREDLRFSNTHPIIDQYIRDNFDPVSGSARSSPIRIYISRQARQ